MILYSLLVGFFLSGAVGVIFFKSLALRAEWFLVCLICFMGAFIGMVSKKFEADFVGESKPKPQPAAIHRNADALARLIEGHERRILAQREIDDAKQRLIDVEVSPRHEVRSGDFASSTVGERSN